MDRIRIYNSNKEYYYFNTKHKNKYKFYPKKLTVCKHSTKKLNTKTYTSGRLLLPSKWFPSNFYKREYLLIKLYRTHIVSTDGDKWGFSYLLFIKNVFTEHSTPIILQCNNNICKKIRENYSRISTHSRTSHNKKYISGKIYLPGALIGKNILFIELLNMVKIKYVVQEKALFQIKTNTIITDQGRAYVLFYEDLTAKTLNDSFKKTPNRDVPVHITTITMLSEGNTIQQIAKKRNITTTTVWEHICRAFKKRQINSVKLKEIIISQCNKKVKDKIIVFIESQRRKVREKNKKIYIPGNTKDFPDQLELTLTQLKEKLYKETGQQLPLNMIQAIVLFLNSMYKK